MMENSQDNQSVSQVQLLKDGLDFLFQRLQYVNQALSNMPSDLSSQRVLDLDLDQQLSTISDRIYNTSGSILELSSGKGKEQLKPNVDELLEGQLTLLTDVTDSLFERVDIGLDHIRAQLNSSEKAGLSLQKQTFVTTFQPNENNKKESLTLISAKNLNRPQVSFTDKIDNSASTHFVSWVYRNMSKPHAIVTLDKILTPLFDLPLDKITLFTLESKTLPHPYDYEIRNHQPPESFLTREEVTPSSLMEETPLHYIETVEQLEAILPKLLEAKELAIDLEHHDYLTYQGFTCLMQISTRSEDFIIDTLKLRKELFILNQAFANPQIVKVLHGADFDVIWLQRDFGLYLVGLFDTYQASKLLNLTQKSLAYLLKSYIGFEADKKYQLADWRIRPLTREMINYARADTHFLLEIYDHLKNELIDGSQPNHPNQLYTVLDWSQEVALKRYEKPVLDFENGLGRNGWANILKKFNVPFSPKQFEAFRSLHRWRDMIARQQDDSVKYVLPDHLLIKFSQNMPTTTTDVFKMCDVVPNIVRSDATEIVNIINEAKNISLSQLDRPTLETPKESVAIVADAVAKVSIESNISVRPLSGVLPPNLPIEGLTQSHSQLFGEKYGFSEKFHIFEKNAQVDQILSNLRFSSLPSNVKIIFDEGNDQPDEIVFKKPKTAPVDDISSEPEQKVYQLSTSTETTKPNEALISEPQIHLGSSTIVNPEDTIPSSGYDYEAELNKMAKDLHTPAPQKSRFVKNTKKSFNPQNESQDIIPQPKRRPNYNEKGNRSLTTQKGRK